MRFTRVSNEPYIAKTPGTFYSKLVANPDVLEFKASLYFFFRGQGEEGHDQIGLWKQSLTLANGVDWDKSIKEPIVEVSKNPADYDSDHILDPAAIVLKDSIYLYCTAKEVEDQGSYAIGLSISIDGNTFVKHQQGPILRNAIAPEVVFHEGLIYLFFQRHNKENDSWELYSRTSKDGIDFDSESERLVFKPSKLPGEMDSQSTATFRIFQSGDYYYMAYGACQKYLDYPENFGIARSQDLINWERSLSGPIFTRGNSGDWDEAAIWYPTIHKIGDTFFMWYEGAGTGNGLVDDVSIEASRLAREVDYGGYLESNFSQVGLATLNESEFSWQ
jgi:predicted GH43/DUF377 family glycosyl hydrolase